MKVNLTDLDYFRTKDDIIFLTKGYYHPENIVIAIPVFRPDPKGGRIHDSGRKYRKDVEEFYRNPTIPKCAARIPLNDIVEVFKPRQAFKKFLTESSDSIWHKIALAFREEGIPLNDIGIFGSYLVGLAEKEGGGLIKDVDFLIYGLDNFRKLRNGGFRRIQEKLGFGPISQDHIAWHAKKYGQYFEPGLTNFQETLKRKWPALQIAPGILTTVRFIYKKREIPPNPITSPPLKKVIIRGKVVKDEGAHFMPRVFEISSSGQIFRIVTYFWAFYCAVKEGDEIEITGTIHQDNKTISIDDRASGIKILN